MTRPALAAALFLATGTMACGGAAAYTRASGAVGAVTVQSVAWNPSGAEVGTVRAVADSGGVVAVFGDAGATVLSSGAVVATDTAHRGWVDAQTIPGADGSTAWIVGVGGDGHVYYLRGLSAFEDVTSRYGLTKPVRGAALLGPSLVGFRLDGEIAVADGATVTRYAVPATIDAFVGGGGFSAARAPGDVYLLDPKARTSHDFALAGVTDVALGKDGRLYASTTRRIYAGAADGDLAVVYDAAGDTLHGLVASAEHVWFADGAELGVIDGDHVSETSGTKLAAGARLASSTSGDVWAMAGASLQRFSRASAEPAVEAAFRASIAPVFARACSSCHLPSGPSGIDLSTPEAWQAERANIHDRVVVRHTMPPEGHTLSDTDLAAIRAWTESTH